MTTSATSTTTPTTTTTTETTTTTTTTSATTTTTTTEAQKRTLFRLLKVSDENLYMHAWGGSADGNAIKLHGGMNYAMTYANSKFTLEDVGNGLYIIKVSDANLYMHVWGGSRD